MSSSTRRSLITETLWEQLVQVFQDSDNIVGAEPPATAKALLRIAGDDTPINHLVQLMEENQALTRDIMGLVGCGISSELDSADALTRAIGQHGVCSIRDAAFETWLSKKAFDVPEEYREAIEGFRWHSVVTAHFSRVVCRQASIATKDAFICGLLHDVGFAALLFAIGRTEGPDAPPLSLVHADVELLRTSASAFVLQRWGIPQGIRAVLARIGGAGAVLKSEDKEGAVAVAVSIAECLTQKLAADTGIRCSWESSRAAAILDAEALEMNCRALEIGDAALLQISREGQQLVRDMFWQ